MDMVVSFGRMDDHMKVNGRMVSSMVRELSFQMGIKRREYGRMERGLKTLMKLY